MLPRPKLADVPMSRMRWNPGDLRMTLFPHAAIFHAMRVHVWQASHVHC